MSLYLCIDCGGTKAAAVIVNHAGTVLGRGRGGPANYTDVGLEAFLAAVQQATEHALSLLDQFPSRDIVLSTPNPIDLDIDINDNDTTESDSGFAESPCQRDVRLDWDDSLKSTPTDRPSFTSKSGAPLFRAVFIGAAGIDRPQDSLDLQGPLSVLFGIPPGPHLILVNDTTLLASPLRQYPDVSNAVVTIAGTGSIVVNFREDKDGSLRVLGRAGGWGWLLGDEGSGFAVGKETLRRILAIADEQSADDDQTQVEVEAEEEAVVEEARSEDAPVELELEAVQIEAASDPVVDAECESGVQHEYADEPVEVEAETEEVERAHDPVLPSPCPSPPSFPTLLELTPSESDIDVTTTPSESVAESHEPPTDHSDDVLSFTTIGKIAVLPPTLVQFPPTPPQSDDSSEPSLEVDNEHSSPTPTHRQPILSLQQRVFEHFGITSAYDIFNVVYAPDPGAPPTSVSSTLLPRSYLELERKARMAALTPIVFHSAFTDADPLALEILQSAAQRLAQLIAGNMAEEGKPRGRRPRAQDSVLCFGGSLVGVPEFREIVVQELVKMGHAFRHVEFVGDAAASGALRLVSLFEGSGTS